MLLALQGRRESRRHRSHAQPQERHDEASMARTRPLQGQEPRLPRRRDGGSGNRDRDPLFRVGQSLLPVLGTCPGQALPPGGTASLGRLCQGCGHRCRLNGRSRPLRLEGQKGRQAAALLSFCIEAGSEVDNLLCPLVCKGFYTFEPLTHHLKFELQG